MKRRFETVEEILELAIKREVASSKLYQWLKRSVEDEEAKVMLEELSDEELRHQQLLEDALESESFEGIGGESFAETFDRDTLSVAKDPGEDASPQEVMLFAIKREEEAVTFYTTFKKRFEGLKQESLFERLADEERKHKAKLEGEYDRIALKDI
jgi:rubrerythrin